MLNKILIIFLSSLVTGCYTNKVANDNFDMTNSNKTVTSQSINVEVIPIPELETNPEIESFNFENSVNNLNDKTYIIIHFISKLYH